MDKETLYLKARAKINLAIDVTRKREDGYHDLRMIMQTVGLSDKIIISKGKREHEHTKRIKLSTNLPWLPTDEGNLVFRAADFLLKQYEAINDAPISIDIRLQKKIPVCAGMGGGSADCAVTLQGVRNLLKLPISNDELMGIGKQFGADVPYCVMQGTALAEGIGEQLKSLPPFPMVDVLIVKPPINVSTAEVFKQFRLEDVKEEDRPDIEKMIWAIEKGELREICPLMKNTLESVTVKQYPVIGHIKETMLAMGADGALMSGSGPSVFGLYTSKECLQCTVEKIRREFPTIKEIFATQMYNKQ